MAMINSSLEDYTIIIVSFDKRDRRCIIEPVHVPDAENATETGQIAAKIYAMHAGVPVQPLYATHDRVNFEKLSTEGVLI